MSDDVYLSFIGYADEAVARSISSNTDTFVASILLWGNDGSISAPVAHVILPRKLLDHISLPAAVMH